MSNQDKIFYNTILKSQLEDYKSGEIKMTVKDAEILYLTFGITTTVKHGEIEFGGIYE